jgi:hypothetical protein
LVSAARRREFQSGKEPVRHRVAEMIRRHVADDNSCLFNAIAYSASSENNAGTADDLRKHCAETAEKEANFFSPDMPNDLILGMDIPEYQEWIVNTFHW